jgi:hypothetical protein
MPDQEIIPFLQQNRRVTFFTRNLRFFEANNRSRKYCLVCLAVGQYEVAVFVRKILQHPELNTSARRMGKIVRATHTGLRVWQVGTTEEGELRWPR